MLIRPLHRQFPKMLTKPVLVNIFMFTNSLVWYAFAINILEKNVTALQLNFLENMLIWSIHFVAILFFAFIGVSISKKFGGRIRFLTIWLLLGTLLPFIPLIFTSNVLIVILLCFIFGFSFGLGMPTYMGYFISQTPQENRGKIGGFMLLFTGLGTAGLGQLISIESIALQIAILAIWRSVGLAIFLIFKNREASEPPKEAISYRRLLGQRSFILYLIPWIMFSLINYLTTPVQFNVLETSVIDNLGVIGNIFLATFAVVGGFFIDSMGRKRMAIIGFVMLGLSYSMIGVFQDISVWYIHTIINGISWGILYALFIVTIWGDLSNGGSSDKYYVLGVTPFFISKFLELTINAQIVQAIPVTAIFSFTAFFLFLAVLPLVYAPETLPEKRIKDRELKNYIEKAQKIKEKNS